jgi:glycosyl transferase family 2
MRSGVDISIVISNYDPKGQLLSCVEHALDQDLPAGTFELVFVVHGEMTTAELAQLRSRATLSHDFRLIEPAISNRAAALNMAVAQAASDRLLFLESHVHAPRDLARTYLELLQSPGAAVVQGAFVAPPTDSWVSLTETRLRALAAARRREYGLPGDEYHLHSAGFDRRTLVKAGGFDERIPNLAEAPLIQRIIDRGGRVVMLDRPSVRHVNHEDFEHYVHALRGRGYEAGVLWRLEPALAARLYPSSALDRHAGLVRRVSPLLQHAADAQLASATLLVKAGRALHFDRLASAAAVHVATAAVRAGAIDGLRQ